MSELTENKAPAEEQTPEKERIRELEEQLLKQTRISDMLRQKLADSESARAELSRDREFTASRPGKAAKKLWSMWHRARSRAASAVMPSFHRPESGGTMRSPKTFPLRVQSLKELRVACIMDRFSYDCYSPECQLFQLTPDNWKREIEEFCPDMLFIESAWQGKELLWERKVANAGRELYSLTDYCRMKKIPIVFWSKEDPVHFNAFFSAAQMADFVFTTEIDCVRKYKEHFMHDGVYLLHFAAQPKIHNPLEKFDRRDRFCFAGAYYHNYPDRCRIFDDFADIFDATKGLDIYDRNYGHARPEHAFPERYNDNILGSLDPSEIDVAYKGYNFGVNMNSITQSQTMFARRVFELFASNTIVVGNFSRGVNNLFGDLTISTDDAATLKARIDEHCSDEETMRKLRLLCLRRVLSEHLYEDRLAYIVSKVFGADLLPPEPEVAIFGFAANAADAQRLIAAYRRQTYKNCHLYLICDSMTCDDEDVTVLSTASADTTRLGSLRGFDWVAVFSPEDYYGENYLYDLMLTRRYSSCDAFGKSDFYCAADGEARIGSRSRTYRLTDSIELRSGAAKTSLLAQMQLSQLNDCAVSGKNVFCTDEFGYCRGWRGETCPAVDDLVLADAGIHMSELTRTAENVRVDTQRKSCSLDMQQFSSSLQVTDPRVVCNFSDGRLVLESTLPEEEFTFIWCRRMLSVSEFAENGEINVIFMGSGSATLRGYCTFYDKERNRLLTTHTVINRHLICPVPEGAEYFLLSLKVIGPDSLTLTGVMFGEGGSILSGSFLSRSDTVILTNHYPSADQPYRNMFVHKRVLEYRRAGFVCDVLRVHPSVKPGYREYMGVNIAEGQADLVEDVLSHGSVRTVCVHFLDRQMWNVLSRHLDRLHLVIWCHGADIQPWWRRKFNFTEEQLEAQKQISDERMALWREVFAALPEHDITMVFVSQYAADETMEDYGVTLSPDSYRIIHNYIDTDLFSYEPKDAQLRKKILSIKSFSSMTYANDLTANAIIELSQKPEFSDMEFDIYGRGALFEEQTAPLKGFENVHLHEQFLTHDQIAQLHRTHGLYIATTRSDTQGVSRDEAMSSGLVPLTNAVTAIPEFVDESCGILAPAEDFHAIADGILRLYNDPELFCRMSAAAAARVRRQTAREQTINREIELITGREI